jgi:hypothetical protein
MPLASGAGAVQSIRPVPSSVQVAPGPQSTDDAQIDPRGRRGPDPGSQRPLLLQVTQHPAPPPEWQSSPDARHVAIGSMTHLPPPPPPPSSSAHSFEQHSTSVVQSEPSRKHSGPLQIPPLHPSAQQSLARLHGALAGRHSGRHASVVDPATGSQRPLQH